MRPPRAVFLDVEAVAREVGHVDPAHERDLAVDRHGLLVMAVKRVLRGQPRAWIACARVRF